MPLSDLHHVALKTKDLAASEEFYVEVLGMEKVDRPEFDFPGAWLQMGETMFHLMAGYAARGPDGETYRGSGAVDHLAIKAQGFDEMRDKFEESVSRTRKTTYGISVSGSCLSTTLTASSLN